MKNSRFLFTFIVLLLAGHLHAQVENYSIPWKASQKVTFQDKDIQIPSIENQELIESKPVFVVCEEVKKDYHADIVLHAFGTTSASADDINYLNTLYIEVPEQPEFEGKVVNSSNKRYRTFSIFPFVKENGVVKKITAIEVKFTAKTISSVKEMSFASESVLKEGSGFWYKIGVSEDGIYKIDKSFLTAIGIDVENLDPSSINIFGNGDGKLPEHNSTSRTDDLAKNAIQVIGEGDGSFDDEDYILFYGWGPHRWYANGDNTFVQNRNIYSDVSYYFININPSETPLRIVDQNSMSLIPTDFITDYNYRDIHERDLQSLVKGGQRWYGETFDVNLSQTFTFNIPNVVIGNDVLLRISVATNNKAPSGTNQKYTFGSQTLLSTNIPTTGEYARQNHTLTGTATSTIMPLRIDITRSSPADLVFLDRIELNTRRNLVMTGIQFPFADFNSVGTNRIGQFTVSQFPINGFVWDVTERHGPLNIVGSVVSDEFTFIAQTDSLRQFVASDGLNFLTPTKVGVVNYQNLHNLPAADYLIVSHKNFITQAERLANLHRAEGLSVHVVSTEQVFNEFSSGGLDPTAIKSFAKMFYDRNELTPDARPKYLLLFGDGTYDPKNRIAANNNFVPTYQMLNSELHAYALVTDDYFGLLDDTESNSYLDKLDIGIGRLLISDNEMASQQVDKIEHYLKNGSALFSSADNCCDGSASSSTFGDWRLNYTQIADDEENGYFIYNDVEPAYDSVNYYAAELNCDKIYIDSYQQITTAGGQRSPDVNKAINTRIRNGSLVMNYVGHGGEVRAAEETIMTIEQVKEWENINNMPLFVTATCEFTKYDDPSRVSIGEWLTLNPNGAAIATMTTTRSVYFTINTMTIKSFFKYVFQRDSDGKGLPFGEIIRLTKNNFTGNDNKRSFTLIGDPALRIALPYHNIKVDSINGTSPDIQVDTIRALSKVTIKGHIEDNIGNPLNTFNGTLSPTIFDKVKLMSTLGQDHDSPEIEYELQKNIIYRGKATITNGMFEFSFIVPKDINYSFGNGKISLYGSDISANVDAGDEDTRIIVGGIDPNGLNDDIGPTIELFINSENFANGGITNENPTLIAKIFDENGINTVGNGIGHDIIATLDDNNSNPIVLNEYYSADLDSYQSGKINFQFEALEPGLHSLTLKVWDVNNNSSTSRIDFEVRPNEEISLEHVLNYPNPFTTHTEFFFEHNQVCNALQAQVQIFTVSGKLVKTINQSVNTNGFRSEGIEWDGNDDFGDTLAKGVYVYRLSVTDEEGNTAEKLEKLVLLK